VRQEVVFPLLPGGDGVAIEAVIIQAIVTVKERGIQNDGRGTNSIARAL